MPNLINWSSHLTVYFSRSTYVKFTFSYRIPLHKTTFRYIFTCLYDHCRLGIIDFCIWCLSDSTQLWKLDDHWFKPFMTDWMHTKNSSISWQHKFRWRDVLVQVLSRPYFWVPFITPSIMQPYIFCKYVLKNFRIVNIFVMSSMENRLLQFIKNPSAWTYVKHSC